MAKIVNVNANYWGKQLNGDCVVRSLSLAFNLGYMTVCRMLNLPFTPEYGYRGRFDSYSSNILQRFKDEFEKKRHLVEAVYEDSLFGKFVLNKGKDFLEDPYLNPYVADSLDLFLDMYKGTGRYLICLRPPNEEMNDDFHMHMVYADSNT